MLPIILYNTNGSKLTSHTIVMRSPTFFFYSYEKVTVKIIEGPGIFFSVLQNNGKLIAKSDYSFSDNSGYTLYNNGSDTKISVTNSDDRTEIFEFIYKPDNILTEEQEHYNDLLINHYLPTFEELEPALIPGAVKSDLIKRLLLDFKDIMRSKGTKESIKKFFYFIGFLKEQIQVLDEYRKNSANPDSELTQEELLSWVSSKNITTNPDTTVDTKTGNYHVLFNNWNDGNQNGIQDVNEDNMPYRPFSQENFDVFFESLKYAIALANKYFTLVEQEITFFGISMSVNIPMYKSVTSSINQIFETDLNAFRKFLHIDVYYNYVTSGSIKTPIYLVKNCLQKDTKAYRTEIKFISKESNPNSELFEIYKEYADNESIPNEHIIVYDKDIYTGEFTSTIIDEYDTTERFNKAFANILHVNVKSPNTYVQITIENLYNEFTKLIIPKQFVKDTLHIEYLTAVIGNYKITVDVYDKYNNHEKYWYFYEIDDDIRLLDIDLFTSADINDKYFDTNSIDLDIDSGSLVYSKISDTKNYILPIDIIPDDLRLYWKADNDISNVKWLSTTTFGETHQLVLLPEINKNYKVNKITETIPVTYSDQWFEFIVIPELNIDKLAIKLYDVDERTYKTYYLRDLFNFELDPVFDKLFIRKMKIYEQELESYKTYLFISSIETGINIYKDTFDLQYITNEYDTTNIIEDEVFNFDTLTYDIIRKEEPLHIIETQSIYDIKGLIRKQIPVNFDFPLFPIQKTDENFVYSCITDSYPIVKSIFPRLKKGPIDLLYLGDIIVARLNSDTVCGEYDIKWLLKDAFDGSVLYTTNEYALKYRLKENTIYTIQCNFTINGKEYSIEKTGIVGSWKNII